MQNYPTQSPPTKASPEPIKAGTREGASHLTPEQEASKKAQGDKDINPPHGMKS